MIQIILLIKSRQDGSANRPSQHLTYLFFLYKIEMNFFYFPTRILLQMRYFTTEKSYEKAIRMLVQKRFKVIYRLDPDLYRTIEIDTATEYMKRVFIVAADYREWTIRLWDVRNYRNGVLIEYTLFCESDDGVDDDWDDMVAQRSNPK